MDASVSFSITYIHRWRWSYWMKRLWSAGRETNIRLLLSTLHLVIDIFSNLAVTYFIYIYICIYIYIYIYIYILQIYNVLINEWMQILWPDSGWYAIPLTSLVESSQVKKVYQKARLCLHPDKLQQRGATLPQKYVAEKAFSILLVSFWPGWNQDKKRIQQQKVFKAMD
jgi:hypothetical protein